MRNILLTISYKGTNYHGFQVQENSVTVEEVLQNAVETLLKEKVELKGCSRTDAGVHANMYCVSFKTDSDMGCEHMRYSLDALLPDDIAATDCEEVPDDFHARYSCKAKRYIYKIWNAAYMSPFYKDMALHYKEPIDEDFLDAVATDFIGKHDFSAFTGSKNEQEDCTRNIMSCEVTRDGDLVTFSVTGDGFLYNMVRIMVGTLLFINEGKIEADKIPEIIESKDRQLAGKTARPEGLYLDYVFYEDPNEDYGDEF